MHPDVVKKYFGREKYGSFLFLVMVPHPSSSSSSYSGVFLFLAKVSLWVLNCRVGFLFFFYFVFLRTVIDARPSALSTRPSPTLFPGRPR